MINRGFGLTFDAEREYTEIDLGRWMRATLNAPHEGPPVGGPLDAVVSRLGVTTK